MKHERFFDYFNIFEIIIIDYFDNLNIFDIFDILLVNCFDKL